MSTEKIESWRDLLVWQKAHVGALEIYRCTKNFPPEERYRLIDQLCRAAVSVPTNIAEGKGRGSLAEFRQFLVIARGSTEETRYLLLLAKGPWISAYGVARCLGITLHRNLQDDQCLAPIA
jgi:four helix bundle protein